MLVVPQERRVVDLRRALAASLGADGATREAADSLAAATFPGSKSAAIALGKRVLDAARELDASRPDFCSLSFDAIRWLPATDPSVVRDGLTFIEHIKGFHQRMGAQPAPSLLKAPGYFKGTPWTLFGQDAEIPWPGFVQHMDYELELGFVIGRRGQNVTPQQARNYLFGVTIFNDFSARDRQAVEMPIGMGPQKCKVRRLEEHRVRRRPAFLRWRLCHEGHGRQRCAPDLFSETDGIEDPQGSTHAQGRLGVPRTIGPAGDLGLNLGRELSLTQN